MVISLRETVQFMCVMEIKVNTQKNTCCEKKLHLGLECDTIMIGERHRKILNPPPEMKS